MGNGNRTSSSTGGASTYNGADIQSLTPLNCTVNSYNNKKPSPYNNYYNHHQDSNIFNTQMLNHRTISGFCSDSSKDGKKLFTAGQWEELERQTMIYKYIMASVPVPAYLLSSTQSNRVNVGLRFSNGSDPEPWRCRRTDGKKWRCAKDIVPDQKYCERHSHKTRSRSRKPVETQIRNTKDKPTVLTAANQQTKCSDLFLKNDAIPVSQLNSQFQQPMQKQDQIFKQDFKGDHQPKSYMDHNNNPYLNTTSSTGVDVWSSIGSVLDDCSLTLSMQSGGSGIEFDDASFQMAVGLLNGDREGFEDVYKPHNQWPNQGSWVSSGSTTPGGPLGEALCLGIAGTTNSPQSDAFHNGYSNSTNTSGSCEGGGDHGFGFIG